MSRNLPNLGLEQCAWYLAILPGCTISRKSQVESQIQFYPSSTALSSGPQSDLPTLRRTWAALDSCIMPPSKLKKSHLLNQIWQSNLASCSSYLVLVTPKYFTEALLAASSSPRILRPRTTRQVYPKSKSTLYMSFIRLMLVDRSFRLSQKQANPLSTRLFSKHLLSLVSYTCALLREQSLRSRKSVQHERLKTVLSSKPSFLRKARAARRQSEERAWQLAMNSNEGSLKVVEFNGEEGPD